jgi:4,5-dihydroxyphthalate decarboxylase
MKAQNVEVYGGDYEHVLGISGAYHGIDVTYFVRPLLDIFETMLTERNYDACEFSLSNYIMLKAAGAEWLHAVPIFPYRAFRHSTLHVRRGSTLIAPAELRGKVVGVPDYSMTAAVWTRGILDEQYGVHWSEVRWVTNERQRFPAHRDVDLNIVNLDLETALMEGRIDALLSPTVRDGRLPGAERHLRPLIANAQEAEEAYFREHGIYPINHVVVIRDVALSRLPQLPLALFAAYTESKERAYRRRLGTTLVPWGRQYWTKVFDQFDQDPLQYGLTPVNRNVIGQLARFLYQQKLTSYELSIDELFLPHC